MEKRYNIPMQIACGRIIPVLMFLAPPVRQGAERFVLTNHEFQSLSPEKKEQWVEALRDFLVSLESLEARVLPAGSFLSDLKTETSSNFFSWSHLAKFQPRMCTFTELFLLKSEKAHAAEPNPTLSLADIEARRRKAQSILDSKPSTNEKIAKAQKELQAAKDDLVRFRDQEARKKAVANQGEIGSIGGGDSGSVQVSNSGPTSKSLPIAPGSEESSCIYAGWVQKRIMPAYTRASRCPAPSEKVLQVGFKGQTSPVVYSCKDKPANLSKLASATSRYGDNGGGALTVLCNPLVFGVSEKELVPLCVAPGANATKSCLSKMKELGGKNPLSFFYGASVLVLKSEYENLTASVDALCNHKDKTSHFKQLGVPVKEIKRSVDDLTNTCETLQGQIQSIEKYGGASQSGGGVQ